MANIIDVAADLGIAAPRAKEGSKTYKSWVNKVKQAKKHHDIAGDLVESDLTRAIAEQSKRDILVAQANEYALQASYPVTHYGNAI